MQKLSKMESFKNFQISKQSMNQITGSRTVSFGWVDAEDGSNSWCAKQIDTNDGAATITKIKARYEGRC